ncbi:hypothetical protein GCA01S_062_00160 [Parageobacillus caldoxylosilyticus NBRC 107762]|uniref:Uncharacterized protein n=1 Tax=Parageobacillus caldoxylosilyticus NBRC 107762 TaxID=1220594 RepID=A0A023DJ40_9BACL|nr:hypothetical protein GCA01S_062_00160 [Parageobacillus caldoxylosilyticus NBRC 107762]
MLYKNVPQSEPSTHKKHKKIHPLKWPRHNPRVGTIIISSLVTEYVIDYDIAPVSIALKNYTVQIYRYDDIFLILVDRLLVQSK